MEDCRKPGTFWFLSASGPAGSSGEGHRHQEQGGEAQGCVPATRLSHTHLQAGSQHWSGERARPELPGPGPGSARPLSIRISSTSQSPLSSLSQDFSIIPGRDTKAQINLPTCLRPQLWTPPSQTASPGSLAPSSWAPPKKPGPVVASAPGSLLLSQPWACHQGPSSPSQAPPRPHWGCWSLSYTFGE